MAWLYRQKASKNWWLGWRANGRKFQVTTGTPDRKQAQAQLLRQEAIAQAARDGRLTQAFIDSFLAKPLPQITLSGAVSDWLSECKGSTSPKTLAKYKPLIDDLTNTLGGTALLRDVGPDEIRRFLTHQRARLSAATVNGNRKVLATFFSWAFKNQLLQANPVLAVKRFKAGRDETQARRAFSLAEVQLLHSKAPDDFWRYMVLAGFYTGQRLGDLATLTWGSVDFGANLLRITQRKTGTALQIPIAAPLRSRLDLRHAEVPKAKPSDFVWPEPAQVYLSKGSGPLSNAFYEILSAAGLAAPRDHGRHRSGRAGPRQAAKVSFHSLRHTFVSALKIAGGSQAVAKELAGHNSNLVSDHYTHTGDEALRAAIARLPEVTP